MYIRTKLLYKFVGKCNYFNFVFDLSSAQKAPNRIHIVTIFLKFNNPLYTVNRTKTPTQALEVPSTIVVIVFTSCAINSKVIISFVVVSEHGFLY